MLGYFILAFIVSREDACTLMNVGAMEAGKDQIVLNAFRIGTVSMDFARSHLNVNVWKDLLAKIAMQQ